jgi:hypothetical protein
MNEKRAAMMGRVPNSEPKMVEQVRIPVLWPETVVKY